MSGSAAGYGILRGGVRQAVRQGPVHEARIQAPGLRGSRHWSPGYLTTEHSGTHPLQVRGLKDKDGAEIQAPDIKSRLSNTGTSAHPL